MEAEENQPQSKKGNGQPDAEPDFRAQPVHRVEPLCLAIPDIGIGASARLRISREDMQSLNEELTTVNAQLQARMEQAQAISNDLTRLLSSTDIAALFLDLKLSIRRFTPAVSEVLDLIQSDVGRPLSDMASKFRDPGLVEDARAVAEKLAPREREVLAANGKWYVRRTFAYRTSDNRIEGVVLTFVDISERKRMVASLAERARLLDLSNDVITVRDMSNRITYWNQGAAQIYGWSANEAVGHDMDFLLRTENAQSIDELVCGLQVRDRMVGEVQQSTRDGRKLTMLCRWALDRDADANPHSILTTANDITEFKKAEESARQSERTFGLLFDAIRDFAVFILDADGNITTWNAAAQRLLGWTEKEAIGRSFAMLLAPEDRALGSFEKLLLQARQEGRVANDRWQVAKDGRRFWGSGVMAAITEGGVLRGFATILRDETLRKQGEEALLNAKRAAEAANQMKDEFLATLSHELRTPLSTILLWAKMLKDRKMEPRDMDEGLSAIKHSADAQTALIDDLLDTSRIMSGKLRLVLLELDLEPLLRDAVEAILPAAKAKDVEINLEVQPGGKRVIADADRLRQVVWNLLTNAVKFTPEGGRITVSLTGFSGSVEIRVSDTGRGISSDFLPYVFDRFRQADASTTRQQGGLGLGLSISKQLVELHGGTIEALSEGVGRGATFRVVLPAAKAGKSIMPAPAPAKRSRVKSALSGVHILLVEDDQATRNALTKALRHAGARVMAVDSATGAMRAYEQELPDLIVSDIGLPDEDGYALMNRIRQREVERKAKAVPAVALTAFAREQDRQQALRSGFNQCYTKPIEPDVLIHGLAAARHGA